MLFGGGGRGLGGTLSFRLSRRICFDHGGGRQTRKNSLGEKKRFLHNPSPRLLTHTHTHTHARYHASAYTPHAIWVGLLILKLVRPERERERERELVGIGEKSLCVYSVCVCTCVCVCVCVRVATINCLASILPIPWVEHTNILPELGTFGIL